MRTDREIKADIEEELRFTPDVDPTDIGISVNAGIATLSGFCANYSEKVGAEIAARRIRGVAGLANEIQVSLSADSARPGPEIARHAVAAIAARLPGCNDIRVTVMNGHVSVEGTVAWPFCKTAAEDAVRHLRGVTGITNFLKVVPQVFPSDVKHRIEDAFSRAVHIDADHISVEVNGHKVTLKGAVRSWLEYDEAQRAVAVAPGVSEIDNQLTIGH